MNKREEKTKEEKEAAGKNPLEWTVFGISVLLIIVIVAVLAREAWATGDEPSRLEIELGVPEVVGDRISVPVKVTNQGDRVASNVEIEVEAGETKSGFTLDFVPRQATQEGRVWFPLGAEAGGLKGRVSGYEEP